MLREIHLVDEEEASECVCLDIRCVGDDHVRSIHTPKRYTIAQVKLALPRLWTEVLDPQGVRLIHRGRLLEDDVLIETLEAEASGRVLAHAAIRPGALSKNAAEEAAAPATETAPAVVSEHAAHLASAPGESAHDRTHVPISTPVAASSHFSAPPRAPGERNRLVSFVEQLHDAELEPLAHTLYITFQCYTHYYEKQLRPKHGKTAPRLVAPFSFDWAGAEQGMADRVLRTASVDFAERTVMQWMPLQLVCRRWQEQPTAPARGVFHYDPVEIDGLSYVRRTYHEPAPQSTADISRIIEERMVFLNDVMLALARLHDVNQWKQVASDALVYAQSRHAVLPWRSLTAELVEILRDLWGIWDTLFWLSLRVAFVAVLLVAEAPKLHAQVVVAGLCLFTLVQCFVLVRQRRRERSTSQAPATASPPLPTNADEEVEADEAVAMLQVPILPPHIPRASPYTFQYWLELIARYNLADEERAMGFEHDTARGETPRIRWVRRDWTQVREPGQCPSSPLLHAYVAMPLFLAILTLYPQAEELRSDALSLRRDAILGLAKNWERLRESGKPIGSMPRVLEHPYAKTLVQQEAQRQRRRQHEA
ncbi:hypothetical protein MVES1_000537 [Malassezia vespertilionis]|uniref:Ubiquitin-like domain-containing protein n=1 Tax=Malassezia vespertilionis TaxID=2020962 RepID=A0A2N1JGG5_9BASI|nr:uncharacterized protein MVES1_000537 [Malassezia vespertilionis]PKI85647.1 hypothetical protein MVES_000495 [Malassezia vespertilionis]WFD05209.1 hypothetical protein MVES1_000537 [Malassezia vespertilionis]